MKHVVSLGHSPADFIIQPQNELRRHNNHPALSTKTEIQSLTQIFLGFHKLTVTSCLLRVVFQIIAKDSYKNVRIP